jgi:hypothetical protein
MLNRNAMQFIATVVALVLMTSTHADYQMADGISEQSKGTVTQYRVFENETDLGIDYGI